MNILYIESSIPPERGGIQRVTWIISRYLISKRNDVFFAYFLCDSDDIDSTHKIKYSQKWNSEKVKSTLIHFILQKQIDVVICQDQYTKGIFKTLLYLKRNNICKIISCFHLNPGFERYLTKNTSLIYLIKRLLIKLFENRDIDRIPLDRMYNIVDKLVLLSPSFIEGVVKCYGLPSKEKLTCIPNPLSFNLIIKENDISCKKKQVLIIARLVEVQKNILSALNIWKIIETYGCNGWELIIGGYGQDEDMVLNVMKTLELKHCHFVGKVEKPMELYKQSQIFMMTSNYEGFGMTLTEALQMGCVPLAFDNFTALHDIISDSYNGYIIPSGREDLYANKLFNLMNDDSLRGKMISNAIISSSRFSIENVGEQWIKLLKELISYKH